MMNYHVPWHQHTNAANCVICPGNKLLLASWELQLLLKLAQTLFEPKILSYVNAYIGSIFKKIQSCSSGK